MIPGSSLITVETSSHNYMLNRKKKPQKYAMRDVYIEKKKKSFLIDDEQNSEIDEIEDSKVEERCLSVGEDNNDIERIDTSHTTLTAKRQETTFDRIELFENQETMVKVSKILSNFPNIGKNTEIKFQREIDSYCIKIIEEKVLYDGVSPVFDSKICIVGPRKGGKSVFLQFLSKNILVCLSKTDYWRNYFYFCLDFADVTQEIQSIIDLYIIIVKKSLLQLSYQNNLIEKHIQPIQKMLLSLPKNDRIPSIPKTILDDPKCISLVKHLEKIVQDGFQILQRPQYLSQWLDYCCGIPVMLSKMVGFQSVYYIFDHFDSSDITIFPEAPFNESSQTQVLSRYFKNVINAGQYIVSCQDEELFYQILTDTEPNLISSSFFYSIADLPIPKSLNAKGIRITFKDATFVDVGSIECSNCLGFLIILDLINNEISKQSYIQNFKGELRDSIPRECLIKDLSKNLLILIDSDLSNKTIVSITST